MFKTFKPNFSKLYLVGLERLRSLRRPVLFVTNSNISFSASLADIVD